MAYLAKSTVLHAYKLLSGIDSEKQQGLTQKVSALKYASALDLFYKNHGQNCDLKQSVNRDEFASHVGEIVKINYYHNQSLSHFEKYLRKSLLCRIRH